MKFLVKKGFINGEESSNIKIIMTLYDLKYLKVIVRGVFMSSLVSSTSIGNIPQMIVPAKPQVRVGLGVIIIKDGKVLLGKRKNAHGDGHWSPPGGHLEFMETWQACAAREVLEETGLTVENIRFLGCTNDFFEKEQKHYVTIWMRADYKSGTLTLCEPDKCEGWQWFDIDALPQPLFVTVHNFLKQYGLNSLNL